MSFNDYMEELRSELQHLSTNQLHNLRDNLEDELSYMDQYADQWNEFSDKYKTAINNLSKLSKLNLKKNPGLIKLGDHVFTKGKLINPNKVLVYLGDGYFAKMNLEDGKSFFERKTECLKRDADDFEEENSTKQIMFTIVEEALHNKLKKKENKEVEQQGLLSTEDSSQSTSHQNPDKSKENPD